MFKNMLLKLLCSLTFLLFAGAVNAEGKITVYAAASLTNALGEVSTQYERGKSITVAQSYAASSTLSKQIENGAPADVFISADTKWMDYLQDKKRINTASRTELLGNRLVLIVPKGRAFNVRFDKDFDFSKAFDGRLCTGDIDSVPAGIYAKQSLEALNWWNGIKNRIVGAQDVRGALAFVERGECAAGIVYETDAKISNKVEIAAIFPEDSHKPIVYPVALVVGAKPGSQNYLDFLKGPEASVVFTRYGFSPLKK